jgi:hypothetical protein
VELASASVYQGLVFWYIHKGVARVKSKANIDILHVTLGFVGRGSFIEATNRSYLSEATNMRITKVFLTLRNLKSPV